MRLNVPEDLHELIPQICTAQTSADPEHWTPDNPTWGHCAVVALLAQRLFGGKILRASLAGTPFEHMRSHYWNVLGDGQEIDFTRNQFGGDYPSLIGKPIDGQGNPLTREALLSNPDTCKRYLQLTSNILNLRS